MSKNSSWFQPLFWLAAVLLAISGTLLGLSKVGIYYNWSFALQLETLNHTFPNTTWVAEWMRAYKGIVHSFEGWNWATKYLLSSTYSFLASVILNGWGWYNQEREIRDRNLVLVLWIGALIFLICGIVLLIVGIYIMAGIF